MPNVIVKSPFFAHYCVAVLLITASGLVQAAPQQLTQPQARHLLIRSGFAPTQAQVDALQGQGAAQAVDAMIAQALQAKTTPAPEFTATPAPIYRGAEASREEQQAFRQEQNRLSQAIKNWWMLQMLQSPTPLAERMALLWHGHFATSQQKVLRAHSMWNQHLLLRQNALGSFKTMLHAVAKDPAMLVYLDGANSRKDAPNENFAREVMELFVLGESSAPGLGGYTEADIKEAARAFTGWSIERSDFSYAYRPRIHDAGSKTLLGSSGNFDGDAALDVMLARPEAARFVATKLWREFISPTPEPAQLERIAQALRAKDWSIAAALREVFLSDAFWDAANRGALVKSPVELLVGTARQFGLPISQPGAALIGPQAVEPQILVQRSAALGQHLLQPPNVKGWPGYTQWINSTTLLERKRFLEVLLPTRFDASAWLASYSARADSEPGFAEKERIVSAILPYPATQNIASGTVGLSLIRALVQDSAYQLK
jgi:uncharacterized protein (DUF1800 family)